MSDTSNPAPGAGAGNTDTAANEAQQSFGRYKARLAVGPVMMPHGGGPAFAAAAPSHGRRAADGRPSLTDSLGLTVKLGFDLLNAALASGTAALTGVAGWEARMWGEQGAEPGCGCGHDCGCGSDCCGAFDCGCCRPTVRGCGC
jgi:hypothetical protein